MPCIFKLFAIASAQFEQFFREFLPEWISSLTDIPAQRQMLLDCITQEKVPIVWMCVYDITPID